MSKEIVEKFKSYFTKMEFTNESILNEIYFIDVQFTDPIHEIQGLQNLIQYFNKLNDNLDSGSFVFTEESSIGNKAFLSWDMKLKLKKPNKYVTASGITVLTIDEKIIKHRDYFDAGELFYENVPLVGGLIRFLKKKIANRA